MVIQEDLWQDKRVWRPAILSLKINFPTNRSKKIGEFSSREKRSEAF